MRTPFTLIELLMVVAVIGILAGILLPAMNTVRKTTMNITCLGNIRQHGNLAQLYADDFQYYPIAFTHYKKKLKELYDFNFAGKIDICPANTYSRGMNLSYDKTNLYGGNYAVSERINWGYFDYWDRENRKISGPPFEYPSRTAVVLEILRYQPGCYTASGCSWRATGNGDFIAFPHGGSNSFTTDPEYTRFQPDSAGSNVYYMDGHAQNSLKRQIPTTRVNGINQGIESLNYFWSGGRTGGINGAYWKTCIENYYKKYGY